VEGREPLDTRSNHVRIRDQQEPPASPNTDFGIGGRLDDPGRDVTRSADLHRRQDDPKFRVADLGHGVSDSSV
jgi:hypothetical protein